MRPVAFRFAVSAILMNVLVTGSAAQSTELPSWVGDDRFAPIFDMYWRARLHAADSGNRLCALPNRPNYDDPASPFRPINQRMQAAAARIDVRWPGALNTVARPYRMPPPQSLCDDQKPAYEALFAFETAVTAVERLLDDAERHQLALERENGER